VVDVSDPRFRIHIQTTDDVLKELGAGKKSRQLVFNKIDKASAADLAVVKNEFPTAWFLSALDKENVHDLHRRIVSHFESQQKVVQVHVPFAESKAIGEIRKVASVLKEEFIETGAILDLQLKPVDLDRLRSHFTTLDFKDSK
jgi:GTP-binding protein HflX